MAMSIELITFIVLVIIVLIIICFICMVIRKSNDQNVVQPDGVELQPFRQMAGQLEQQPIGMPLLVVSVNEVVSRAHPQMNVRLGGRVEELEFGEAAAV